MTANNKPLLLTILIFIILNSLFIMTTAFYEISTKSLILKHFTGLLRNELLVGNRRKAAELTYANCKTLEISQLSFKLDGELVKFNCTADSLFKYVIPTQLFYDSDLQQSFTTVFYEITYTQLLVRVLTAMWLLFLLSLIFYFQIRSYLHHKINESAFLEAQHANAQLARKLAHDIRSPLSTLNLISGKIQNETAKELQLQVIQQINAIADELLDKTKQRMITFQNLIYFLTEEISLKSKGDEREIRIVNKMLPNHLQLDVLSTIQRHISNAIQNAVEATLKNGKIIVTFESTDRLIYVSIADTGVGIPKHILQRLGKTELSFDRNNSKVKSGNGIAVLNLFNDVQKIGGNVTIESKEGSGTCLKITFLIPSEKNNLV